MMNIVIVTTLSDTVRGDFDQTSVFRMSSSDTIEPQTYCQYDAVCLHTDDTAFASRFLSTFRRSGKRETALFPIFISLYAENYFEQNFLEAFDGSIYLNELTKLNMTVEKIREKLSTIYTAQEENFQEDMTNILLQYIYSRELLVEPSFSPASKYGFFYPAIACFFEPNNFSMYELLKLLEDRKLLLGSFIDRIHLCNKCHGGFLNFKEVCPSCQSANVYMEDNLHHFSCGYVGKISKFLVEDAYICPKCGKMLRHIGVDYDKPSMTLTCQTCHHEFQDPIVQAECLHCRAVSPAEYLIQYDIKQYRLTEQGMNAACYGFHISLSTLMTQRLHLVDYSFFKNYLKFEYARETRYGRESTVIEFQIGNLDTLTEKLGVKFGWFFDEMATIIKNTLRPSDLLSVLNYQTFIFLLTDTNHEGSQNALDRIVKRVKELLKSMDMNNEIAIDAHVWPLSDILQREEKSEESSSVS